MEKPLKIIGVAGTAGAGKDTVAEILSKLFDMQNLSSGDVVRAVTRHVYELPADFNPVRDQLYEVANFLRTKVDPAFTVKICVLEAQVRGLERVVISGLRSMGEVQAIREAGGIIVGVDADPRVRYERIYVRGRDTETQKTMEQFLQQDKYENRGLSHSGVGRGIGAIIESADVVVANEGTLQELEQRLRAAVTPLLK